MISVKLNVPKEYYLKNEKINYNEIIEYIQRISFKAGYKWNKLNQEYLMHEIKYIIFNDGGLMTWTNDSKTYKSIDYEEISFSEFTDIILLSKLTNNLTELRKHIKNRTTYIKL